MSEQHSSQHSSEHNVVWFEVVGADAAALRGFYGEMFGWKYEVIEEMNYGLVQREAPAIGGGVGAAQGGPGMVTFYVEVPDIQAHLDRAERLGGKTVLPPLDLPSGGQIGLFADPEGHVVGVVRNA